MIHVVVLTILILFTDGSTKSVSAVAPDLVACMLAGKNLRASMLTIKEVDQVMYNCLPADIKPEPKA